MTYSCILARFLAGRGVALDFTLHDDTMFIENEKKQEITLGNNSEWFQVAVGRPFKLMTIHLFAVASLLT